MLNRKKSLVFFFAQSDSKILFIFHLLIVSQPLLIYLQRHDKNQEA